VLELEGVDGDHVSTGTQQRDDLLDCVVAAEVTREMQDAVRVDAPRLLAVGRRRDAESWNARELACIDAVLVGSVYACPDEIEVCPRRDRRDRDPAHPPGAPNNDAVRLSSGAHINRRHVGSSSGWRKARDSYKLRPLYEFWEPQ
jgi:hypothetical protein